ncbi:MAG: M28 family peptidase [Anaerolineae bacterium]|nr:M28 family peptidase [Anaerolineae bacterium]
MMILISVIAVNVYINLPKDRFLFDGQIAFDHIEQQLNFGSRSPGTPGHDQTVSWIIYNLKNMNWTTQIQTSSYMGHSIQNIIAKKKGNLELQTQSNWIIFSAHYDTRIFADESDSLEDKSKPVAGANDGASGVAILLELARVIPDDFPGEIWLVFFDAEDNGGIDGWDWILGSTSFVEQLVGNPDAVILVDMVGDANLNIYKELNSDTELSTEIWQQAASLGYSQYFIPVHKYRMLDDHIPFIRAGIPAVDLIDFDYPYWHTTEDTLDKVSANSLKIVGNTLLAWLETRR